MPEPVDLRALLSGEKLDRETIDNLRDADPEQMRELLRKHLPDAEVERILQRVRELLDAADSA